MQIGHLNLPESNELPQLQGHFASRAETGYHPSNYAPSEPQGFLNLSLNDQHVVDDQNRLPEPSHAAARPANGLNEQVTPSAFLHNDISINSKPVSAQPLMLDEMKPKPVGHQAQLLSTGSALGIGPDPASSMQLPGYTTHFDSSLLARTQQLGSQDRKHIDLAHKDPPAQGHQDSISFDPNLKILLRMVSSLETLRSLRKQGRLDQMSTRVAELIKHVEDEELAKRGADSASKAAQNVAGGSHAWQA